MGASTFIIGATLFLVALVVGGGAVWLIIRQSNGAAGAKADGPRLQISLAGGSLRELPLPARGMLTIGRDPACSLTVEHHLVSRRHARIVAEAGSWLIEDTDSANGTFLNGRSVLRTRLSPGDLIEIGPARITLVGLQAAPVTSSVLDTVAKPGPASDGATGHTSRQLFGNYAVVRSLGEGGFGKIMLAQEQRGQRLVALKLLNTADDYLITKFRQEGAIKLDHQHIARIYDTGEVNGRLYIAMEYVDGVSLRKLLEEYPMELDVALIIIGQMLMALEYAHRHKIIHRDIKPENVMISAQHGVKIIDFGIAKVLSTVTRTRDGMVIGTPQYMSYEQAMGLPVTPASDIYATAIVLYELLTAHVPFSSENAIDIVRLHQSARPLPPSQLNPAIPPAIEAAIMRGLEKEQNLRFSSALEFATALGCPLGRPLPPAVAATIARHSLPVSNERSNTGDLHTRAPASAPTPSRSQPVLRVQSGPRRGQVIALAAAQVVGRMEIDPADGTISRQHFRLEQQRGAYLICDSSSYGTVVNGQRLKTGTPYPLQPGAQIQVGQTVLIYEYHA